MNVFCRLGLHAWRQVDPSKMQPLDLPPGVWYTGRSEKECRRCPAYRMNIEHIWVEK